MAAHAGPHRPENRQVSLGKTSSPGRDGATSRGTLDRIGVASLIDVHQSFEAMSEMGPQPDSCTAANSTSIQSLPWRGRAACRHFEAESHGGLEVDRQLEFGRMPHWDGLRAFRPSGCDRPGWPTLSPDRSSRPRVLRMARSPEGPPHRAAGRSCCRDSRKNYTTARPCPDRPPRPAP